MRFRADWLYIIGIFFFILNICLFLLNCVMISLRFYLRPGSFTHSFTDQVESLFIPAFVSRRLHPQHLVTFSNSNIVCIVRPAKAPTIE